MREMNPELYFEYLKTLIEEEIEYTEPEFTQYIDEDDN